MAIPKTTPDIDNAFRRYQAGESAEKISGDLNISRSTFLRRMVSAGIEPRSRAQSLAISNSSRAVNVSLPGFIERYQRGEFLKSLCLEYGIGRKVAERHLRQLGVPLRSIAEAVAIRYAHMDRTGRQALTAAAHEARRGSKETVARMERRALTRQRTLTVASRADLTLAMWLAQRGIVFTPQKAVGRYNIDIAIHEPLVAVEVDGDWHAKLFFSTHRPPARERREFILSQGWRLIEVRIDGGKRLRESCADRIVSLLQEFGSDKTERSQHCVIWGNGDDAPALGTDGDHGARILSTIADLG